MKNRFLLLFTAAASIFAGSATAQNQYGLPQEIKDGNILHCFDWRLTDIKKALPEIAEAGFGAIQISPMQRNVPTGRVWSELYRPADFAFSQGGIGTEANLRSLCEEAESYGIKIIMDVVFNHVDNGTNHTSWWNAEGRMRSTTSMVNYGNRFSITHDRIGDYPEVNSEDPEVTARAKAYIEQLKDIGISGIRFDAAKHIALPSEGCDFWSEVCSVPGMFYYGEILSTPGGSNANALMKEYTQYMSVTDDVYGNSARTSAGAPGKSGNWALNGIDPAKLVYWGESHDTYSNAGGSTKNVSQAVIDRAYAIVACRNNGIALYFSRPSNKEYGDIKVGQKGSDHFTDNCVAEVNKFKNAMIGRDDFYSVSGNVASVTRKDGGVVIVNKIGAGTVNAVNGGGFCPPGTYTDRISGNVFTVTSDNISGTVGASGIAVLYNDNTDSGIDDIIGSDGFDISDAAVYNLQGVKMYNPTEKGIYILIYPNGKSQKYIIP